MLRAPCVLVERLLSAFHFHIRTPHFFCCPLIVVSLVPSSLVFRSTPSPSRAAFLLGLTGFIMSELCNCEFRRYLCCSPCIWLSICCDPLSFPHILGFRLLRRFCVLPLTFLPVFLIRSLTLHSLAAGELYFDFSLLLCPNSYFGSYMPIRNHQLTLHVFGYQSLTSNQGFCRLSLAIQATIFLPGVSVVSRFHLVQSGCFYKWVFGATNFHVASSLYRACVGLSPV